MRTLIPQVANRIEIAREDSQFVNIVMFCDGGLYFVVRDAQEQSVIP